MVIVVTKPNLRAVGADETAAISAPKHFDSVADAAEKGTRRDFLAASRRKLAEGLDNDKVASNSWASVSKRIDDIDAEIRRLDESAAAKARSLRERDDDDESFNPQAV